MDTQNPSNYTTYLKQSIKIGERARLEVRINSPYPKLGKVPPPVLYYQRQRENYSHFGTVELADKGKMF